MCKTPFDNHTNFVELLINKTWIISIDDDEQLNIKLLRDSAIIVVAEQLPELIADTEIVNNEIAKQIYTLLSKRFK